MKQFFLWSQISLQDVDVKSSSNQYRIVEEFKADVQLIVHNIVIYHGGEYISSLVQNYLQSIMSGYHGYQPARGVGN